MLTIGVRRKSVALLQDYWLAALHVGRAGPPLLNLLHESVLQALHVAGVGLSGVYAEDGSGNISHRLPSGRLIFHINLVGVS